MAVSSVSLEIRQKKKCGIWAYNTSAIVHWEFWAHAQYIHVSNCVHMKEQLIQLNKTFHVSF